MGKLEIINAALAAGHLTVREALAAVTGPEQESVMVHCEAPDCGNVVPFSHAYSMAVVYRRPGNQRNSYQCADEQHWGCCHAHAIVALAYCLEQHINTGPYNPVPHPSVTGS